jgi:hypothetical protein
MKRKQLIPLMHLVSKSIRIFSQVNSRKMRTKKVASLETSNIDIKVNDSESISPSLTVFEGTSNYTYDAIGNLISDSGEEIEAIAWTVTGKVKSVTRNSASSRSDLVFDYDAMGNRISKTEKMRNGSGYTGETKTTYYMRPQRDPLGRCFGQSR